jgi:hypothetical protein
MPWERAHYVAGGGDALLHYVVPGAKLEVLKVSRSRHRVSGVPEELGVVSCSAREAGLAAAVSEPVLAGALDAALGPGAEAVRRAESAVVVRGAFRDPPALGYLRDTLGVLAALLDAGGLAVLDPLALRWWSPHEFRSVVHAGEDVDAFQHVALLRSHAPDGAWFHTRGLVKFGRPDLSLPGVAPAWEQAAVELIERLAWAEVRGHVIPDGEPIRMAGIPDGLVCRRAGSPDDPDFNNVHVAIGRRIAAAGTPGA